MSYKITRRDLVGGIAIDDLLQAIAHSVVVVGVGFGCRLIGAGQAVESLTY